MNIDLNGRLALITGGSRGIGRAIAQRFAASGARVIVAARRAADLDEAVAAIRDGASAGAGAWGHACDVSDAGQVAALHDRVVREHGTVDILVNAICVGHIVSDQWTRFHAAEAPDEPIADYLARRGRSIPLGRLGTAEEVANVACLLASDRGSYVTGAAINVDGGRSPVL